VLLARARLKEKRKSHVIGVVARTWTGHVHTSEALPLETVCLDVWLLPLLFDE
jgi:hypothetical protein